MTKEAGGTNDMFGLILDQVKSLADDQKKAREADRAEFQKAIKDLTKRMEAPIISDEEDVEEPPKQQAPGAFAIPVKKKRSGRESRIDPVAKLRADKTSNAQAQLLLSSRGARMRQEEDEEVTSGYYRTLADHKNHKCRNPNLALYGSGFTIISVSHLQPSREMAVSGLDDFSSVKLTFTF